MRDLVVDDSGLAGGQSVKIVLSRKGIDSSLGGAPSPIFPDRTMFSVPVPLASSIKTYNDVRKGREADGPSFGRLVEDLTNGRIRADSLAHLDPDLDPRALERLPGWRPCFGQTGAAQSHLHAEGVGPGDLFLFFGWFREVARDPTGTWKVERSSANLHVIFGWLQIGEVIQVAEVGPLTLRGQKPWLADHPHPHFEECDRRNTIYVAADSLVLPGVGHTGLPGAGELKTYHPRLRLTAEGAERRSQWLLPKWFTPDQGGPLTYHSLPERWRPTCGGVFLEAASRGQEFVLDCRSRPQAAEWVLGLLREPSEGGLGQIVPRGLEHARKLLSSQAAQARLSAQRKRA